jgi:hypothetical protein
MLRHGVVRVNPSFPVVRAILVRLHGEVTVGGVHDSKLKEYTL